MSEYLEKRVKPLRRAIILSYLEKCRDYVSNADILTAVINGTPDGVTAYYNDVVEDLRWLEAKGYVSLTGQNVVIATCLPAGLRIARKENVDPGVSRDLPEI
ncbi:hypothetical protein [Salipiger marinus]|uniref:hypothetical protein n=1 Tax=Salipiger marinus TaxID=555512 RepID=UPI00405A3728